MPDDAIGEVTEILSAPMEELITALGRGVGAAQAALDRHSIEIQQLIDTDPVLGQYGLQASWYQIPATQLELKMAVAMQQPPDKPAPAIPRPDITDLALARPLPKLWLQPVNARYANQFGFQLTASSSVSLTIVPVPPPAAVTATPPTHTQDEVLAAVQDRLVLAGDAVRGRVSINFNPGVRTWFVLQTEETDGEPALIKLLRVDDVTLAVTREEPVGT
jgi:hypothetical protein